MSPDRHRDHCRSIRLNPRTRFPVPASSTARGSFRLGLTAIHLRRILLPRRRSRPLPRLAPLQIGAQRLGLAFQPRPRRGGLSLFRSLTLVVRHANDRAAIRRVFRSRANTTSSSPDRTACGTRGASATGVRRCPVSCDASSRPRFDTGGRARRMQALEIGARSIASWRASIVRETSPCPTPHCC